MIPEFIERAPFERGFKDHYDSKIKPLLDGIEMERIAMKKVVFRRFVIAILYNLALLGASIVIALTSSEAVSMVVNAGDGQGLFFYGALYLIPYPWAIAPQVKFSKDYKDRILPVICEFYGGLGYSPMGEVDVPILKSGLFNHYTSAKAEDFIQGSYHGIGLKMYELRLKKKSGKKRVTVFKGLTIIIDFPKSFQGKTLIRRDKGTLFNWMESHKGLERIELEDPKFESIFEVHASDQVEARYLLTTAFMERLLGLANHVNQGRSVTGVQALFSGHQLALAVPTALNLFEPKRIHKSAFDLEDLHIFLAQMNDIFEMITLLKIDRN